MTKFNSTQVYVSSWLLTLTSSESLIKSLDLLKVWKRIWKAVTSGDTLTYFWKTGTSLAVIRCSALSISYTCNARRDALPHVNILWLVPNPFFTVYRRMTLIRRNVIISLYYEVLQNSAFDLHLIWSAFAQKHFYWLKYQINAYSTGHCATKQNEINNKTGLYLL